MRFRFIGQYTNGHTSINANGVDFQGYEPAEVADSGAIASLKRHPEFEEVGDEPSGLEPVTPDGIQPVADGLVPKAPSKRRGRKPKAA